MHLLRRSLGSTQQELHDERVETNEEITTLSPNGSNSILLPSLVPSPTSIENQRATLPQLINSKSKPEIVLDEQEESTDAFKQAMWAGQANILVTVRVRPHCPHDRDDHEIVKVLNPQLILVLDKTQLKPAISPQRIDSLLPRRHPIRKLRTRTSINQLSNNGSTRTREKRYAFDHVFTKDDTQQTVYYHTTKFLIHGVLNGFNATVFAYGCTGAGKTYTMLGTPEEPGIMALTLEDLFQQIDKVHQDPLSSVQYKVSVSFLEVYNENIRDLLVTPGINNPNTNEYLDLREDPVKGPVVAGILEVEACNAQDVMKLLRRGNKHRSQEATAANAVSSRSHAVLQVLVEQREKHSMEEANSNGIITSTVHYGKLSLVDLAGSERAAVTQNRGQRLIEGANINRSLLALGNCINALGEKGAMASGFVPYRDSKLTRLLKDSLGGNCRTVMIAAISQASSSVEETLNTLKYANRAKNIKATVTRNVLSVDHHLSEYNTVISGLKEEISVLKKQLIFHEGKTSWISRLPKCISSSSNHQEGEEEDEIWKQRKVDEARKYINQCFQQRLVYHRQINEFDSQEKTNDVEIKRKQVVSQLERNELIMSEFKQAIETSPLIPHEYYRELLLMEYKIGTMSIDNLKLRLKQRSMEKELSQTRTQLGLPMLVMEKDEIVVDENINDLVLPKLDQLFSSRPTSKGNNQADLPSLQLEHADEEPETHTARSTFAFLDRFYDRKVPPLGSDKMNEEIQAESVSPRRLWGIHLKDSTLPYIRLKKKTPVMAETESGESHPVVSSDPISPSAVGAAIAAPYLKVLKHRRKLQASHRSSLHRKSVGL